MRMYTFINYYLSSVQVGIQSAHCIVDMFVKYADEAGPRSVLVDWAANHKTMICLNGGNAANIRETYEVLCELGSNLRLPFGSFHEDEQSLNGAMTCCGIIVPQHIYDAAALIRSNPTTAVDCLALPVSCLSVDELSLAQLLNQYGLAK